MNAETVILYRPVGPEELQLIAASGYRGFPRRLPEQPIFYPVLNEEYARQIARDWNVKASALVMLLGSRCGGNLPKDTPSKRLEAPFMRSFGFLPKTFLKMNLNVVGLIEVIAEFV